MQTFDKIYVLTSGEYSDYSVHAVYTSKEKAEADAHLLGHSFNIEERMLDPDFDALQQGMRVFEVILRDGIWSAKQAPNYNIFDLNEVRKMHYAKEPPSYQVYVLGADTQQALKAGTERIRQHRALAGVTYAAQEQEDADRASAVATEKERRKKEAEREKLRWAAHNTFNHRKAEYVRRLHAQLAEQKAAYEAALDKELKEELDKIANGTRDKA